MNPNIARVIGGLAGSFRDGPWRAGSVWAALAAVVVGLGLWLSGIRSNAPPEPAGAAATQTSGVAAADGANPGAGTRWNWQKPLPFCARVGASYVAGFFLGWFARKLIRLIAIVVALIVAFLALGKYVGWNTAHSEQEVKHGGEWAQHEVTTTESLLRHRLPSAVGGGTGIFFGFRRRGKYSPTQSADPSPQR